MIRNLKALGLALVAVFAMSAVAASAAQAQATVTGSGATWLTFDRLGEESFQVYKTEGGAEVKCTTVSGHATVKPGDTAVTATGIAYSGCTAKVGASTLPATVNMTGCDYKFTNGETETTSHVIKGQVSLLCPEGVTGPDVFIYMNATEHAANKPLCTLTVWKFEDHGNVSYTDTPETSGGIPNDFDIKAEEVETPVTRDNSILCGSPKKAFYTGEITVTGFKDEGVDEKGNPKEGARTGVTIS